MSTRIPNFYSINGVIDTSKSVLENMNLIAEAAGCWMTYDITQGKWAVIINGVGNPVASFDDTNILGSVNISSSSFTDVYNSVEMEFPHKDLTDQGDYVRLSVTDQQKYPNEPDNVLSINSQLINNQAQAQSIAGRALKQSRIDKVINFQADYSYIGLKAGEIISITNAIYGWNGKLFRITSISEEDADDGNIVIDITALEYDSSVYSTGDLQITQRDQQTGIRADYLNSNIVSSNNNYLAKSVVTPASISTLVTQGGFVVTAGSFTSNQININKYTGTDYDFIATAFVNSGSEFYDLGNIIIAPYTGNYTVEYIVNFSAFFDYDGAGSAILPNTSRKRIKPVVSRNGSFLDLGVPSITSVIKGSDPLLDLSTVGQFTATQDDQLGFYINIRQDLGSGDFINTPYCYVFVSVNLVYLGT